MKASATTRPCLLGSGFDGIHFIHIQRERLFAQDVFARFDSFDRPFGVQMIGKRNVDDVNFRGLRAGLHKNHAHEEFFARERTHPQILVSAKRQPANDYALKLVRV
jgi:hypothetical protein